MGSLYSACSQWIDLCTVFLPGQDGRELGALISGDFDAVMPLTWNKKFGFKYLYQPYFTVPLGVFSKSHTAFDISSFLQAIPPEFKYWDIDLNENNFVPDKNKIYKLRQYARTNYILSLQE